LEVGLPFIKWQVINSELAQVSLGMDEPCIEYCSQEFALLKELKQCTPPCVAN
jgi:hypothetical protein